MAPPSSTTPLAIRILIADDNSDSADSMAQLLTLSLPSEVEVVYDGIEALRRVQAKRPDALILDLHMPGLGGLEVARRVRRHYTGDPPYIIALTGRADTVRDLPAIDRSFDRAFAKPPDMDQLIATLARLASGNPRAPRAPVPFDLAELFTRAARQVLPIAAAKGLSFTFDYRGPGVVVEDDPIEVQCGLHRLLLGLVDSMQSGLVMYSAEATVHPDAACTIVVDAAGSGLLRSPAQVAAVLERLGLTGRALSPQPADGQQVVAGTCPNTGAPVLFAGDAREGVLLRTTLSYRRSADDGAGEAVCPAGSRAWLVDRSDVGSALLRRRLQRLGWSVDCFASCAEALVRAQGEGDRLRSAAPALLVVVEESGAAADADALQRRMPARTQRVFAVMAGSAALGVPDGVSAYDLRIAPLSPLELADFCDVAASGRESRYGTGPAALAVDRRPRVLLVDDNEVNRIVGRGLVEALGYEVRTAHDGLDAIDQCRQAPPQLLLMDLDMPVLNGIDTAARLRELQRDGHVAPFAIVAATADASPAAEQACRRAGMDGYLTKPLTLDKLREELRRHALT